jgi:hypothetical protein
VIVVVSHRPANGFRMRNRSSTFLTVLSQFVWPKVRRMVAPIQSGYKREFLKSCRPCEVHPPQKLATFLLHKSERFRASHEIS